MHRDDETSPAAVFRKVSRGWRQRAATAPARQMDRMGSSRPSRCQARTKQSRHTRTGAGRSAWGFSRSAFEIPEIVPACRMKRNPTSLLEPGMENTQCGCGKLRQGRLPRQARRHPACQSQDQDQDGSSMGQRATGKAGTAPAPPDTEKQMLLPEERLTRHRQGSAKSGGRETSSSPFSAESTLQFGLRRRKTQSGVGLPFPTVLC